MCSSHTFQVYTCAAPEKLLSIEGGVVTELADGATIKCKYEPFLVIRVRTKCSMYIHCLRYFCLTIFCTRIFGSECEVGTEFGRLYWAEKDGFVLYGPIIAAQTLVCS